ncbi:4'-phosphopantetheinyl transferase superfamily protein [Paraferrimonas sedimenticola]|uniref:4'-phosphopantetheinyl transferase domain-containing protein n=1 Tax=Paraferrimonas sedimenticola TaxID=375674 RepID=A0AA37RX90_9GAMM|nr:4'-phosphopantetheinyl transferase superfamily protein [Paraferrimonas sedimenticola]GLP97024.1 hypothetical protein GCM10007895_23300 [Paraferrimonas sedimenticola]
MELDWVTPCSSVEFEKQVRVWFCVVRLPEGERSRRQQIGNLALANLIGRHSGKTVTAAQIHRNYVGAPYCERSSLYLSLSHSKGLLAAAVSSHPCGIDIEFVSSRRNYQAIWEYIRNPLEPLRANTVDEFYRWWTVKEATWKLTQCQSPSSLSQLQVCDQTEAALSPIAYRCIDDLKNYPVCIAILNE